MRLSIVQVSIGMFLGLGILQPVMAQSCPKEGHLPVFILAGQSNMVGARASNLEELPPTEQGMQENVLWYNREDEWVQLTPPTEPLPFINNQDKDGFGMEVRVGRILAQGMERKVALVKYAVEGTSLAEDWDPEQPDQLYAKMRDRVYQAIGELTLQGYAVEIAGFFWMQGESDALEESMALAYEENLMDFITQLRQDFHSPQLPFIIGKIFLRNNYRTYYPDRVFPWGDRIRTAQDNVAQLPYNEAIETIDLSRDRDNLHFNSIGLLQLGDRFARAWLTMVNSCR